jgi:hypothetical protein
MPCLVQNNISTFCQVADQILQQKNERYFFSVQLWGIYRFLWKFVLLTVSFFFLNTRQCIAVLWITWCNQMRVSFYSRSFLTINESILGKIQITTPYQSFFFYLLLFSKSILTHVLKLRTNNDRYIVNDRQQ